MPATSAPILVLQSAEAGAADAAAIADLCGSAPPEQVGAHAFRLRGAQRRERVPAWCATRRLDYAWVPEGRRFVRGRQVVSVSVGASCYPITAPDRVTLLHEASQLMQRARREGGDRLILPPLPVSIEN